MVSSPTRPSLWRCQRRGRGSDASPPVPRPLSGRRWLAARAGRPVYEIGRAIDSEVRRQGFRVLRELHGHGVGRAIHEPPSVPQYENRQMADVLTDGMVLTIEPIIAIGTARVVQDPDGWTLRTADGQPSAHFEHTIVITQGRPSVLTAN